MSSPIASSSSPSLPPARRSRARYIKVLFLLVSMGLLSGLIFWPEIEKIFIKITPLTTSNNAKLLENYSITSKEVIGPRFLSTDQHNRPYTITAEKAHHQTDKHVELHRVSASLTMEDNALISLTAEKGILEPGPQGKADLTGNVIIVQDKGYELLTDKAYVDFAKGTIVSDTPVEGDSIYGAVQGNGMDLDKENKIIKILGKSKLTLFEHARDDKYI